MNENQLGNVKKYGFNKPLIHKIDSLIDNCIRVCHNKCFNTIDHICVYDIKRIKNGNNEVINVIISYKSKGSYELKKI